MTVEEQHSILIKVPFNEGTTQWNNLSSGETCLELLSQEGFLEEVAREQGLTEWMAFR